jgi:hypothetical protein
MQIWVPWWLISFNVEVMTCAPVPGGRASP